MLYLILGACLIPELEKVVYILCAPNNVCIYTAYMCM